MPIDPANYIWWLVSRAAGIVALALISLSVLVGLTMATKILRRPGLSRKLARLHEHLALVALGAIAVHGAALLGDRWLHPSVRTLLVPFALGYRPIFTGAGVIAGYLAALFVLSFYVRRHIGTRLWRRLHRGTVLVWILGVLHTVGAGTDAATPWLRATMLVTGAPIVFLALLRVLHREPPARGRAAAAVPGNGRPAGAVAARPAAAAAPRALDDRARAVRPRPSIAKETA